MDEFKKTAEILVNINASVREDRSLLDFEDKIKSLPTYKWLDEDSKKAFMSSAKEVEEKNIKIQKLKQAISDIDEYGNDNEKLKEQRKLLEENLKTLETEKKEIPYTPTTKEGQQLYKYSQQVDRLSDKGASQGLLKASQDWEKIGGVKGYLESQRAEGLEDMFKPGGTFENKLVDIVKNIKDKVTEFFDKAWEAAKEKIDNINKYNLSGTSMYSSDAVRQFMTYGVSGEQGYALQSALNKVGMSSIEDLITAQSLGMTEVTSRFSDWFTKYEDEYKTNKDLSKSVQDVKDSWEDFKEGIASDILQFLSDNKESIKELLQIASSLLKGLLNIVSGMMKLLSWQDPQRTEEEKTQTSLDYLGIKSSGDSFISTSNNTNISQHNTYTNISKTQENNLENMNRNSLLAIITSLNGG